MGFGPLSHGNYGRVIETRWSRFEMRHEADILMYQGTKLFDVPERDLEPGTWTRLKMSMGMFRIVQ
jgi:hypothetical protein